MQHNSCTFISPLQLRLSTGPSSTRPCLATPRPLPPLGCVGSPPRSSRGLPSLLLPGHWQSSAFQVCPPRAAPGPAQFPLGQLSGLFYLSCRRESQVALHFLAAKYGGPPTYLHCPVQGTPHLTFGSHLQQDLLGHSAWPWLLVETFVSLRFS